MIRLVGGWWPPRDVAPYQQHHSEPTLRRQRYHCLLFRMWSTCLRSGAGVSGGKIFCSNLVETTLPITQPNVQPPMRQGLFNNQIRYPIIIDVQSRENKHVIVRFETQISIVGAR